MARKSRKNISEQVVVPSKKKLLTAAYIRLSVENNGYESEDSIRTQALLVESYIVNHPELELVDTFIDNGATGTNFDRNEFNHMMEQVRSGKISCIVVKDLSRFGRDFLETGYYLETILPLLNVRFIAINDNFDSSKDDVTKSLAIPIKNFVNGMYAKDISRKIEMYYKQATQNGRVIGAHETYGYKFDPEKGRLVIDREVEPYVRMIFAWVLEGVMWKEIARRLTAMGIKTPGEHIGRRDNCKWQTTTIRRIVGNPHYAGFHVMGKTAGSVYRNIPRHATSKEEWIMFPNYHEPYITMSDYYKVQQIIEDNKTEYRKNVSRKKKLYDKVPAPLKGKVRCAECGKKLMYVTNGHKDNYTECPHGFFLGNSKYDCPVCRCHRYEQNYLMLILSDEINKYIDAVCDKDAIIRRMNNDASANNKLTKLMNKQVRLEERNNKIIEKISRLYADLTDGIIDMDVYQTMKRNLEFEKDENVSKLDSVKKEILQVEESIDKYHKLSEKMKSLKDGSRSIDVTPKLIEELIDSLIIYADGEIEVKFKSRDVFLDANILELLSQQEVA